MYDILELNEISPAAHKAFGGNFKLSKNCENPAGIILRSRDMHEYALPDSVLAVARAGAGVNNIPIDKLTPKGVVVFNTPGANANAVKELVVCALLLGSRKIVNGIEWVRTLKGKGDEVGKLVETGKNAFVGGEIADKKLGVIGLGAIGNLVSNAAVELGMTVYGFDPYISVDGAWHLHRDVIHAKDINEIYRECDYISLHIPYGNSTKNMIDGEALNKMKPNACLINMSRGELVNNKDLLKALAAKKLGRYVTDFPSDELINVENVICVPHLGASTPEAEDNCAFMAANQLRNYIENGNIVNSVNFPRCELARSGKMRITVFHMNIKNMLIQMIDSISSAKINIGNMVSQSQGDHAYTIFELDEAAGDAVISKLKAIKDVLKIRVIN